jgi:3-methylfumaryl-CoA hydratase
VTDPTTWVGREESSSDVAAVAPLLGLAALLDYERPPWREGVVPPLGHWCYFRPRTRQSELGPDGHARRGGLLPSVPAARRMWAGSRVSLGPMIPIGAPIERRSRIAGVVPRGEPAGSTLFVTVHHTVAVSGAVAIEEEQDIVYLQTPSVARAPPPDRPAAPPQQTRAVVFESVRLFRFSALTFNAHRIHYDLDYARTTEGYASLVVQGPYLAILLMDFFLGAYPAATVTRASFRARHPTFAPSTGQLCMTKTDTGADLWARSEAGVTMTASIVAE